MTAIKPRRKRKRIEFNLQEACFKYWQLRYGSDWPKCYFAIENGGQRSPSEGAALNRRGLTRGVADSFLTLPTEHMFGMWVEFKTEIGRQSDDQFQFETSVIYCGFGYVIIDNFDEFKKLVDEHVSDHIKFAKAKVAKKAAVKPKLT